MASSETVSERGSLLKSMIASLCVIAVVAAVAFGVHKYFAKSGEHSADPAAPEQPEPTTLLALLAERDAIEHADDAANYGSMDEALRAREEANRKLRPVLDAIDAEMRALCPDLFAAFDKHKQLTEVQWPEYSDGLLGKTIVAVGYITNVEPLVSYRAEEYARRIVDLSLADDDPAVLEEYNRRYGLEERELQGEAKREALRVAKRSAVNRLAEDRMAKWSEDPASGPCYVHIEVPALGTIQALADGLLGKRLTRGSLVRSTLTVDKPIDDGIRIRPNRADLQGLEFRLLSTDPFEAK